MKVIHTVLNCPSLVNCDILGLRGNRASNLIYFFNSPAFGARTRIYLGGYVYVSLEILKYQWQ